MARYHFKEKKIERISKAERRWLSVGVLSRLVIAVSLLLAVKAFAQVRSTEAYSQYRIGSIKIVGNVSIEMVDIRNRVRSRVGDLFDPVRADEDLKRMREMDGVASAKWDRRVVDNKIELIFVITEEDIAGPIRFDGNKKIKSKKLLKQLPFELRNYVTYSKAVEGQTKLKNYYLKKGFAFAEVRLDYKVVRGQIVEVTYTINEGPRVKICSVRFRGFDDKRLRIKKGTLKKVIKSDGKEWFLWLKKYTEERAAKDITKLKKFYYNRGFLDCGITIEKEYPKPNKVRLIFVIDEKNVYTVDKIIVTGVEDFEADELRGKLKLEEDAKFRSKRADSDVERLLKFYREQGYIDVTVGQEHAFISKDRVNVGFKVSEGDRFRIGRIDITGNERTQDKVMRRVMDEYAFLPGEWYNADMARGDGSGELEKDVRMRTLADAVSIKAVGEPYGYSPARDAWTTDTELAIKEFKTGEWNWGGGVSTDAGIIGQLIFEQRNFNIKDWPDNFIELMTGKPSSDGAGQTLRIALMPGTKVSEYSVYFKEPYFRDKPVEFEFTGLSWKRERESYDEGRLKSYVGFAERYQKRYRGRWLKSIGFRMERVNVGSVDNDAPQEIADVKGDNFLMGVKLGLTRDLTNDRWDPSKGHILSTSYEQLAGDHTFGLLGATHRWYRTLREDLAERKTILSTKLHVATVIGDAPPFERFYAGGAGLYGIRGFEYRGVSTRGRQRNVANPKRKDPIGSDWIFLASAEVAVPLGRKELAALFFVDTGAIDSGNLRGAVGTGIQIQIPRWFGRVPMRFTVAVPFMKDGEDDTQFFNFSVGRLF